MNSQLSDFNSIKVRLEPDCRGYRLRPYWDFNSIKVRLELSEDPFHCQKQVFQFHKGTIRTR